MSTARPHRICMLLHKSVENDSRVRREARALAAAGHQVTVVHLPREAGELEGELDGFKVVSATPPSWMRRRLPFKLYRLAFLAAFVRAARAQRPDAVHAHDAAMLVPGWLAARMTGARLVYDTHEYAPGVPYRQRVWAWFVNVVERTFIRRADAVITVSAGIAERLEERYALTVRPSVVRNVPDPAAYDGSFQAPDLREDLGLPDDAILVLHLGAAAQDRGGETLVRAIESLPGAHLLFLGADDEAFAAGLREAARAKRVADRVHFRPSEPIAHVLAYTRQAGVGVSLLEDTCENHRLALPNKVFEYLAAGVPVVASNLPELRRLRDSGVPLVLADPGDAASVAQAVTTATGASAGTPPSWTEEAAVLEGVYSDARPSALILVRNGVTHDARVLREAATLDELGYAVTVVGAVTERHPEPTERRAGVTIRRVTSALRARRHASAPSAAVSAAGPPTRGRAAPWSLAKARLRRLLVTAHFNGRAAQTGLRARPHLIHANDYNTMWPALVVKARTGAALVYDSHELWADRNLRPEWRPWVLACEAAFVRLADAVTTTSPGYAEVLAARYRVRRPALVRNVPDWPGPAGPAWAHDGTFVYFGAVTRGRGLETAIRALALIDGPALRIVGPEAWGYRARLEAAAREAGVAERVTLEDPVPPEQTLAALEGAAGGLALIEQICLSYELTMPNKLYEYVHAGLPVLAGRGPVLADAVRAHGVGVVVDQDDPAAVAEGMRELLADVTQRRCREAARAAREEVTWAAERERLSAVYVAVGPIRRAGGACGRG